MGREVELQCRAYSAMIYPMECLEQTVPFRVVLQLDNFCTPDLLRHWVWAAWERRGPG